MDDDLSRVLDSAWGLLGRGSADRRSVTTDGFEHIFQVNTLTPYLLTCLMPRPRRLVYLTSGLEANGVADLDDPADLDALLARLAGALATCPHTRRALEEAGLFTAPAQG